MKYSITGRYNENQIFQDMILPIDKYIDISSINAGNGYFYFQTNDVCSTKYEDLSSLLNLINFVSCNVSPLSTNKDKVSLLNVLNTLNDDCLKEDFTIVSNKQTYYNILQYLEK